jgi:polyhydroxybutyrate depolymerase
MDHQRTARIILVLAGLLVMSACSSQVASRPTTTPTATHTPVPSATPSPTPSPQPTATPLPSVAPTATPVEEVPFPVDQRYQQPGDYIDFLVVNGVRRLFAVHIPPGYQPGTLLPLVVNLHARTRNMLHQEELSRMNVKADEAGFVVVNPQALDDPPTWWGPIPGEVGQPDLDFFQELLAYLQQQISIDPDRIYATGLSNGGTMAYRLGCDMADVFTAIAPVAGGHVAADLCQPAQPVSVLVIHGTEDPIIPFEGETNASPPVEAWLEAWAAHNGCSPTPTVNHPYVAATEKTWSDCDGNVVVTLEKIEGGGHVWPNSELGTHLDEYPSDLDATDVIWAFFEAHPRSPAQ